jgi:hypothetical protein
MKLRASRAIVHLRDFDSQKMLIIRNTTYYSQLSLSLYPLLTPSLSLSQVSSAVLSSQTQHRWGLPQCTLLPASGALAGDTGDAPGLAAAAQKALADFPLSSRVQDHCKMQLLPRGLSALVLGYHWSCAATASADSADACMR